MDYDSASKINRLPDCQPVKQQGASVDKHKVYDTFGQNLSFKTNKEPTVALMSAWHSLIYCISGKLVQAEATALLNLESQSTENSSAAKVVVEVQLLQEEDFKMT